MMSDESMGNLGASRANKRTLRDVPRERAQWATIMRFIENLMRTHNQSYGALMPGGPAQMMSSRGAPAPMGPQPMGMPHMGPRPGPVSYYDTTRLDEEVPRPPQSWGAMPNMIQRPQMYGGVLPPEQMARIDQRNAMYGGTPQAISEQLATTLSRPSAPPRPMLPENDLYAALNSTEGIMAPPSIQPRQQELDPATVIAMLQLARGRL